MDIELTENLTQPWWRTLISRLGGLSSASLPAVSEPGKEPVRILMLTQHLAMGGLERMVLQLSHSLQRDRMHRWTVFVLAYDQRPIDRAADISPLFRQRGISVQVISKPAGFSPQMVWFIVKFLFKNRIQVLHSHDMGSLIYAVCAKLLSVRKVHLVHTQHSFVHLRRHKRYALYERIFTRFVDALAVVSEEGRLAYQELGVAKKRLHVILNGVCFRDTAPPSPDERSAFREKLTNEYPQLIEEKARLWILYLARLHPVKGQVTAMQMFSSMSLEMQSKCSLLFVGPEAEEGEYVRLEAQRERTPLPQRIHLLGGSNQPHEWMCASDLFWSCSKFEGMPLAPLEALGCGLPLFLSDIKGHACLKKFATVYKGSECNQHAVRSLTELIAQLLQNGRSHETNSSEEIEHIHRVHSVETMRDRYIDLYRERRSWRSSLVSWQ